MRLRASWRSTSSSLALEAFDIKGPKTNIPAVIAILRSEQFRSGDVHTGLIPEVLTKKKT